MDIYTFTSKIIEGTADDFFGSSSDGSSCPLNSRLLASVLRYVALKKHTGDLSVIKELKFGRSNYREGDNGDALLDNFIANEGDTHYNIIVFSSVRNAEPLTISKEGYIPLDNKPTPVAPYLSANGSKSTVFVNEEEQRLVIFVKRTTSNWIQAFCSSFLKSFTWLFKAELLKEKPLDEEDVALCSAIMKGDLETTAKIINELCDKIGFEEVILKKKLHDWGGNYRKSQIEAAERNINTVYANISDTERRLTEFCNMLYEYRERLNSLRAVADAKDKDELYNFLAKRKAIKLWKVVDNGSGKILHFSICTTLEDYDKEACEKALNKRGSYFYETNSSREKRDLFRAIFVEEKAKLRVESTFELTNFSSLSPNRQHSTSGNFSLTAFPHPHLIYYRCLGGNEPLINKCMADGEWELAIDQAVQATRNLNFGDSTVLSNMISRFDSYVMDEVKCIVTDDGNEYTPREFLKTLEGDKGYEETEE